MAGHRTIMYRRMPGRGTKTRALLIAMLKPGGITPWEAYERGLVASPTNATNVFTKLSNEHGWVIHSACVGKERGNAVARPGRRNRAYWITGRLRWDCTLRDYSRWSFPKDYL